MPLMEEKETKMYKSELNKLKSLRSGLSFLLLELLHVEFKLLTLQDVTANIKNMNIGEKITNKSDNMKRLLVNRNDKTGGYECI